MNRRSIASFAAATVVTFLAITTLLGFWSTTHEVSARFSNADGLVGGNDVTLHGVAIGQIKSVNVDSNIAAGTEIVDVVMAINKSAWPLRQGTTFAIRSHGVLGNVYVEMNPGGMGNPVLASSHVFGLPETSSIVTLDQLNNVFTPSVRSAIQTANREGAVAFGNGGAQNFNQSIANANPLIADAAPLTDVLAARSPELDRLNGEFATVSGDLAREDSNLRGLIESTNTTLTAIANQETNVQGTLDNAAGTFSSIDQGLAGQQTNLANIFRDGPNTLNEAYQATSVLTPLVNAVNPHVASLDQLMVEFVSATGFKAGGLDTLRVDATLPPANTHAYECGGQPAEQSHVCPRGAP